MVDPKLQTVTLPAAQVSLIRDDGDTEVFDRAETMIETATWGSGKPEIVMAHDGLGSIEQWHSVPARIADNTGRTVLAYNRPGHGASTPHPVGPWPKQWLNQQAALLGDLLESIGVERPLVVGHSDGGTIALIFAATRPVSGVLAISAHTFIEDRCVNAIIEMRKAPSRLVQGLAKAHAEPARLFEAWSGGWTDPKYGSWDVRTLLGRYSGPALIAQGSEDEYASTEMVTDTVAALGTATASGATASEVAAVLGEERVSGVMLEGLGHMVPLEDPDVTVDLVSAFARRVLS